MNDSSKTFEKISTQTTMKGTEDENFERKKGDQMPISMPKAKGYEFLFVLGAVFLVVYMLNRSG